MICLLLKVSFFVLKGFHLTRKFVTVLMVLFDLLKDIFADAIALIDLFSDEIQLARQLPILLD